MITAALLLASLQPLPAQARTPRPREHAWRSAALASQRHGKRLRDLHDAVQSIGAIEPDRAGPSGL
jgi:hypothetical protein